VTPPVRDGRSSAAGRVLLPLAALLLATLACSFGGRAAPAPRWRYTVPDVWQDSSTYTQVDGPRVYLAPKLPPVYDRATQITQAPETHILTALELATGQRLWSQTVEVKFGADWVAADGRIIFIQPATADAAAQTIIALDGATGQEVWRFADMQLDDYLLRRGECLFIFDTAGDLLCLDVASGRVLGNYPPVPTAELGEAGANGVQTRITDDAFYRLSPRGCAARLRSAAAVARLQRHAAAHRPTAGTGHCG
jgi:outer membrane protein assembly factor BamB